MVVGRNGAFGILIGTVVGTFSIVLGIGSAQDAQLPSCANVDSASPFEDLIRCADQGHAHAQSKLGLRYATGSGVPKDDTEAVRWYRLAGEQGDAFAQSKLGEMYYNGWGVTTDPTEAVRWFRLAAEQGVAEMQSLLGMMYDEGRSVPEDDAEAVRWYRLAAEQGDAFGQWSLGTMYSRGKGIPEDLVFAYMWFNLSAAQGYDIVGGNKDVVEQLMTREQIAEGQRLSREWIEAHPQDGVN